MTRFDTPSVPVSWGELLDKITILAIKRRHLTRPDALANVVREHDLLTAIAAPVLAHVADEVAELEAVNEGLWAIEDAIREEEAAQRFGPAFVALARSVYRENDRRAAIKRRINDALGSALVEEKSYADWQRADAAIPA